MLPLCHFWVHIFSIMATTDLFVFCSNKCQYFFTHLLTSQESSLQSILLTTSTSVCLNYYLLISCSKCRIKSFCTEKNCLWPLPSVLTSLTSPVWCNSTSLLRVSHWAVPWHPSLLTGPSPSLSGSTSSCITRWILGVISVGNRPWSTVTPRTGKPPSMFL